MLETVAQRMPEFSRKVAVILVVTQDEGDVERMLWRRDSPALFRTALMV